MSDRFISNPILFFIGVGAITAVIGLTLDMDSFPTDVIEIEMIEKIMPNDQTTAYSDPIEQSANTPINYGGMTGSNINKSRQIISNMYDCDIMIDTWNRNTGWTLRPELAQKILDECY